MAWPFILATASVPLLGIVDTAVIGNTGPVVELGAIALGSLIFSFFYWGFGVLRMGVSVTENQQAHRQLWWHADKSAAFAIGGAGGGAGCCGG